MSDAHQETKKTTVDETMETSDPRASYGWLRRWLTHVPDVPLWQYLSVLVFVGVGFATVYKLIDDNNDRDRARDVAAQEERSYQNALATWTLARNGYDSCVTAVNRSFGSRNFNEWLIDVFESRGAPPDLIAEGRGVLDRELPLRSLDECIDPGPPPVAPNNG